MADLDAWSEYMSKPEEWPKPTNEEPSEETLITWFFDTMCEATDGCTVEHDGMCPHRHVSWLRYLGYV